MEHEQLNKSGQPQLQSRSMIFHDDLTFIESMPDLNDIETRFRSFLKALRRKSRDARESLELQKWYEEQKREQAEMDLLRTISLKAAETPESGWRKFFKRFQRKPDFPDDSNTPDLIVTPKLLKPVMGKPVRLSEKDEKRIKKRAIRVYDRMKYSTGMNHLSEQVRVKLLPLRNGLPITRIETEHEVDEIAARLHAEIPWMASATEAVRQGLRASVRKGLPGIRFEPLILVGSPGIGKSHWVRRLAWHLSLPTTFIDATSEPGSFSLVGTQKGWGTASPGKLVNTMLRERHGGPLVVIDEIEKSGAIYSRNGTRHTLTEALLPLLERMTAKKWECPFFQIRFDMSWVNWVMTANSCNGLPDFLQNRCVILEIPDLTTSQLREYAIAQGRERGLSEPALESLDDVFDSKVVANAKLNLRNVNRMLDLAGNLEQYPMLN